MDREIIALLRAEEAEEEQFFENLQFDVSLNMGLMEATRTRKGKPKQHCATTVKSSTHGSRVYTADQPLDKNTQQGPFDSVRGNLLQDFTDIMTLGTGFNVKGERVPLNSHVQQQVLAHNTWPYSVIPVVLFHSDTPAKLQAAVEAQDYELTTSDALLPPSALLVRKKSQLPIVAQDSWLDLLGAKQKTGNCVLLCAQVTSATGQLATPLVNFNTVRASGEGRSTHKNRHKPTVHPLQQSPQNMSTWVIPLSFVRLTPTPKTVSENVNHYVDPQIVKEYARRLNESCVDKKKTKLWQLNEKATQRAKDRQWERAAIEVY